MPTTGELIDRLSADARPVRPLQRPALRALAWLALAALFIAAVAAIAGVRPGLIALFDDPWFALGRAGALATAVAGALAACELSVPDRSPRWIWLPVPFALIWLAGMGYGCVADWLIEGARGLRVGHSLDCFKTIVLTSLPPGIILFLMVRHAGRVRPIATAFAAGLALAALAEGGLTLYHDVDATLMDIVIHAVAVAVVVGLSLSGARGLFRLLGPRYEEPARIG
jgi:hypothetical protein